jgi:hypothetical protein
MLRPEQQAPKRFVDVDDPALPELEDCDELKSWHGEKIGAEAEAAVQRIVAEVDSERMRDVMMATVAGDESLRNYVDRCLPGVGPDERKVEYERLRRQRLAAITRLRMLSFDAPALAP